MFKNKNNGAEFEWDENSGKPYRLRFLVFCACSFWIHLNSRIGHIAIENRSWRWMQIRLQDFFITTIEMNVKDISKMMLDILITVRYFMNTKTER